MTLIVWRHPRPVGAAGRCIGRTDLALDRRKAKRLAHRIRAWARRSQRGSARVVVTSPLQRTAAVGRWLAAWGWSHRIDARLSELDFGAWDGRCWSDIGKADIDAWCADFHHHAPGAGEPLAALLERCSAFLADCGDSLVCVVGHAGWIGAARWLEQHGGVVPTAANWLAAVDYGARVELLSPPALPAVGSTTCSK